jgi:hypothetical protein
MTAIDHAEAVLGIMAALLSYLLIVQALMAAVLLLAEFTVRQWRHLAALLAEPPRPVLAPEVIEDDQAEPHRRLGGAVIRWE